MNIPCEHLHLTREVAPSADGCEECLKIGDTWVNLRICQTCGHVGCCDSSPNKHATGHWKKHEDHPVMRSFQPGEDWWYCYIDQETFEVPGAPPAPSYSGGSS